jgi:hypothetical protein
MLSYMNTFIATLGYGNFILDTLTCLSSQAPVEQIVFLIHIVGVDPVLEPYNLYQPGSTRHSLFTMCLPCLSCCVTSYVAYDMANRDYDRHVPPQPKATQQRPKTASIPKSIKRITSETTLTPSMTTAFDVARDTELAERPLVSSRRSPPTAVGSEKKKTS